MACAAKLDLAADGASSHDLATSSDFVGREREMGELVSAFDDALAGKGRLVMLVGEPGIGKTRTAEELASYALQQDTRVLWGRCHEQQGMPPYWPWVQIIRTYVRDCDSDQMRSEMGAGAGDIAELVPDAKERLPDIQPPPPLESPEQARFRLFDSITTWLKNASQKQPLVLILDNLHWADKPSLLLSLVMINALSLGIAVTSAVFAVHGKAEIRRMLAAISRRARITIPLEDETPTST